MSSTPFSRAEFTGHRSDALLVVGACAALALGVLVYSTERDASSAWLVPTLTALAGRHWFGALGQSLPSLLHAFAFSLLTAAALPAQAAVRYGACATWAAVDVAFELGQYPRAAAWLADALSAFDAPSLTRPLSNYFVRGTFDLGDIAAALLGAAAAAGVLRVARHHPKGDHAH